MKNSTKSLMISFVIIALLLQTSYVCANGDTSGVSTSVGNKRPPLNGYRIAGELVCGTLMGVGGAGAGGFIGAVLDTRENQEFPPGGFFLGAAVGYAVGSSIGVYLVGQGGNETGSYLTSIVYSIVGMIGAVLVTDRSKIG